MLRGAKVRNGIGWDRMRWRWDRVGWDLIWGGVRWGRVGWVYHCGGVRWVGYGLGWGKVGWDVVWGGVRWGGLSLGLWHYGKSNNGGNG